VSIALIGPRVWGWRIEHAPGALRLVVRAPPLVVAAPPRPRAKDKRSPLAGLHIALEAGHGSAQNSGAIGATGVPEKDINRWTTDALAAELQRAGATVTQLREGDQNPSLRERARQAIDSRAQLFVSVHANAADICRTSASSATSTTCRCGG
jgi:N-acetylmuramoyl-L-alanine amidase